LLSLFNIGKIAIDYWIMEKSRLEKSLLEKSLFFGAIETKITAENILFGNTAILLKALESNL
jgi:hypothetical protein